MQKRLYFCDCCGDEIKEKERCHKITLESIAIRQNYWGDYVEDSHKDYHDLLICDKCYEHEKNGSLVIPRYEAICAEWAKKFEEYEKERRKETGGVMEDTCNG